MFSNIKIMAISAALIFLTNILIADPSEKPILHGRHWVAITGKPLAATAGA